MSFAELTIRQMDVYDCIRRLKQRNNSTPTLNEIAQELGIAPNAVRNHLLLMERKHVLRYSTHRSRGVELIDERQVGIPIYGSAPAGHPFLSQENIVDTFEIRKYLTASEEIFGVIVHGDSMKGAQLSTGDLLFVDPRKQPLNGDIVVASIEGQPTIKRFYRDDDGVVLKPENKKFKPIRIQAGDESFRILGTVVGVIRQMDRKRLDALSAEHDEFERRMSRRRMAS